MSACLAVAVVVPVHDEEALLDACLESLAHAVAAVHGFGVAVVVVLDACADGSAEIARRHDVTTIEIGDHNVGAARRAGVERARLQLAVDPAELWIATTDADSTVPPNWLTHQLDLAARGHDVVLGNVRPDFVGLSADHVAYWHATHAPGIPLGNVHGANLGMRASVYDQVGGFAPLPEHEDADLVDRAREVGAQVTASADAVVVTSARFDGRTPGGYAGFLRGRAAELAETA
ncbi:glycosyltransferase [Planococcus sp. APC 4015]|nr:glycosyltransferase [Planococcus sp. APC 4015]